MIIHLTGNSQKFIRELLLVEVSNRQIYDDCLSSEECKEKIGGMRHYSGIYHSLNPEIQKVRFHVQTSGKMGNLISISTPHEEKVFCKVSHTVPVGTSQEIKSEDIRDKRIEFSRFEKFLGSDLIEKSDRVQLLARWGPRRE